MSNTLRVFTVTARKALIAAGLVAGMTTLGAVGTAAADTTTNGVQCSSSGINVPCETGAVADTDGTQGNWRAATGAVDYDGTRGTITQCGPRQVCTSQGNVDYDGTQGPSNGPAGAVVYPQIH